jgi:hypothetical protein
MIAYLASPIGKIAAAIIVGAVLVGAGYIKGREDGKLRQMKDTVEAVQNRGVINNEVSKLPDYSLCIRLGGLPDDCAQLRGMDATPQGK